MVEHIVLFKLKSDVAEAQKDLFVQTLTKLKSLPGVEAFSAGLNHSREGKDKGFHIGMRVLFTDQSALEHYLPSKEHVSIVNEIRHMIEDVIVVDYTV